MIDYFVVLFFSKIVLCERLIERIFPDYDSIISFQLVLWGIKRRVRKDGGEKTEEVVGC